MQIYRTDSGFGQRPEGTPFSKQGTTTGNKRIKNLVGQLSI
jgi:hypothetical protein